MVCLQVLNVGQVLKHGLEIGILVRKSLGGEARSLPRAMIVCLPT